MKWIANLLIQFYAMVLMALLFIGTAIAEKNASSISDLPEQGSITISGTVEKVENERAFKLRDNTGSIEVRLSSNESIVLKQGDNVTVNGTMEKPWLGFMGKDISATSVQVHKDLPTVLSEAMTKATGISLDKAEAVQIGILPSQGMVQVTGTVDNVSDQKNFTLKDATGTIAVTIHSDENVVLNKGADVTVSGYVNNGALEKKISATHVIVASGTPADTSHMNAAN